jgi:predicted esterase
MSKENLKSLKINDKTTCFYIGPDISKGATPTLFYFALSAEDSLLQDPYNQLIQFLPEETLRIFSLTLPFHEPPLKPQKALSHWAESFEKGEDVLTPFIDEVENCVSYLKKNHLLTNQTAVAGLSRGALIAVLIASKMALFRHLLLFAPLTDLTYAKEFSSLSQNPSLEKYQSVNYAKDLFDRNIFATIGNHDQRVSTENCFRFISAVTDIAIKEGLRSPQVSMHIYPSIGMGGHGTPPEIFKKGALWIEQELKL